MSTETTTDHMDLLEDDHTICRKCGTEYDWVNQEVPDDASFYWTPHCPDCNARMTANPTDSTWLAVVSDSLDPEHDDYDTHLDRLNAYARLYHGRVVGLDGDELVRRARWFDRQAKSGRAYGPRFYRDIAFSLRRQARQQVQHD